MADTKVTVFGFGDRVCHRDDYVEQMAQMQPTFREADIRYCQIEGLFSDTPKELLNHQMGSPKHYLEPTSRIQALKNEMFDVASPNGNHVMEWGPKALLDTIEGLEKYGIRCLGVGKNIEEARKPVIIERKGTKVAFLAYNSINVKPGWAAGPDNPGFVQMRVHTCYEPHEPFQPGTPVKIITFPNREDIAGMKKDIQKAKEVADVVIVCPHVGVHFTRAVLADYQIDVCHAAIDAGADAVIGTHPHLLKAVEVYNGKVIFHSLGNFCFDPHIDPVTKEPLVPKTPGFRNMCKLFNMAYDPEFPYNEAFGREALNNGIAKIVIEDKQVQKVSFIPLWSNQKGQPTRPEAGSPRFNEIVQYLKDITKEAGINTEFKLEGGELVIVP